MLILVISDFHIPHRAHDLPAEFKSLLQPGKIQMVLCAGNLCTKSTYEYLKSVCPDVHIVRGDFDELATYPETKVVRVGDFKVGMCHGHQIVPWGETEALKAMQRKLDVDILITGHTHRLSARQEGDKLFLNPGSATGSYSALSADVSPSFILMDVIDSAVVVYVYEMKDGNVDVKKVEFRK